MIKIYPHKISAVLYLSSCGIPLKSASNYTTNRKMRNGDGYRIDTDAVAQYVKGRNASFKKLKAKIPFKPINFRPGSDYQVVSDLILAGYSNSYILDYIVRILGKTPYYSTTLLSHTRFKLRANGYELPQDKSSINPEYVGSHDFRD